MRVLSLVPEYLYIYGLNKSNVGTSYFCAVRNMGKRKIVVSMGEEYEVKPKPLQVARYKHETKRFTALQALIVKLTDLTYQQFNPLNTHHS